MLIAQLTDLHVRPVGVAANRIAETNMFTQRAFQAVAALSPKPDIVLLTGDLTECGRDDEYQHLKHLLARYLPIPTLVIPGNHDRRENLRKHLAHLPGVTADPTYVQYAIDDHPVRFVMLDTVVPDAGHGELRGDQLEWLDETLAAAPEHPTLIAMHHPPFATGIKHMDDIALLGCEPFVDIVARHKQVQRIVCGHHHRPIVTNVAQAIASISPSVGHQLDLSFHPDDKGAWVLEPPSYQLHAWTEATGFVSHTVCVERFPGPFPFIAEPDYPGRKAV